MGRVRSCCKENMPPSNYAFVSDQNQREDNEDSFLITSFRPFGAGSPLTILAIADGMGGYEHGESVSREALRRICLLLFEQLTVGPALNSFSLGNRFDVEQLGKALLEAVEQTNVHVQRMVLSNKWGKAGSTIVVAAVYEETAVVLNLGDSPLFHYSMSKRTLTQVTEDHTVAGALMRAGLISPEMARIHEGSDRLEFFLGNEAMPRNPPVNKLSLAPGDLLLLCSDGISGSLSAEQIAALLSDAATNGKLDLDELAEQLLAASLAAGESDNQTLILWQHTPAN